MNDKKDISDCGNVLNKSVINDGYKWGLRFYILLMECFAQWSLFTDDPEIKSKKSQLNGHIKEMEDNIYYF